LIQQIVGEKVRVIDPAPAVARQTNRLLEASGILSQAKGSGEIQFFTSGNVQALQNLLPRLIGEVGIVRSVEWGGDRVLNQQSLLFSD
jgi:glutamate racemase